MFPHLVMGAGGLENAGTAGNLVQGTPHMGTRLGKTLGEQESRCFSKPHGLGPRTSLGFPEGSLKSPSPSGKKYSSPSSVCPGSDPQGNKTPTKATVLRAKSTWATQQRPTVYTTEPTRVHAYLHEPMCPLVEKGPLAAHTSVHGTRCKGVVLPVPIDLDPNPDL